MFYENLWFNQILNIQIATCGTIVQWVAHQNLYIRMKQNFKEQIKIALWALHSLHVSSINVPSTQPTVLRDMDLPATHLQVDTCQQEWF